jgi:hypothetical protein
MHYTSPIKEPACASLRTGRHIYVRCFIVNIYIKITRFIYRQVIAQVRIYLRAAKARYPDNQLGKGRGRCGT